MGNAVSETGVSSSGPEQYGGGILNEESSPTLTNCRFDNNFAVYGGGIASLAIPGDNASNPTLFNCRFEKNSVGTGVYTYSGSGRGEAISFNLPTVSLFRMRG